MATKDIFYTAIDVGTSKVCAVIARIGPDGGLKVLGMGVVPSAGVEKGRVVNVGEAHAAIRQSLEEAQKYLGRSVTWTYVGVTGNHISCINTNGHMDATQLEGPVSVQEVEHLIESSYPEVATDKEILHVIPTNYMVDGLKGVRNPVGLHAEKLEVESHVVLGEAAALKDVVKAVESCGISVRSLVLSSLAAGEAVLSQDEKEMGVVLAEIGAGTTDMAIFRNGSLWYNTSLPVGGNQLTRDLAVALAMPYYYAEELKIKYGHANPGAVEGGTDVVLPSYQGRQRRLVKREALCQPLIERLSETLNLVLLKAQQAGLRRMPPGGLVITGGTAQIPGLQEMAQNTVGCPVRIGSPAGIPGVPEELAKPPFATCVGVLIWGIKHHAEKRVYQNGDKSLWGYKALMHRFTKAAEPEKSKV